MSLSYSFVSMVRSFAFALVAMGLCGLSALQADQADLVVKEFQTTGTPGWKNGNLEIPVRFKVKNQGQAATTIDIVNVVRVNNVDRWSGFMGVVSPGESKTVNAIVKIADPNKLQSGRTLQLLAYADAPITAASTSLPPYARCDESNDNNNTMSLQVNVPSGIGGVGGGSPPPPGPSQPSGFKATQPVRLPKFIGKKN